MDYRNWRSIPLPPKMAGMEKDKRGFPIPFIVARDLTTGEAKFQVNDGHRVEQALAERRCAVCGKVMEGTDCWLVGGPLSALHPLGAYLDTPTHHECQTYALRVCPYLAAPRYTGKIDPSTLNAADYGMGALINGSQPELDRRPDFFIAVQIQTLTVKREPVQHPEGFMYEYRTLHPSRPFLAMEYWLHGEQLSLAQAEKLWVQYVAKNQHTL